MADTALATPAARLPAPAPGSIRSVLDMPAIQARFREVLSDRALQFMGQLNQLVYNSPQLRDCDPYSVVSAAITAATLDLPLERSFGFAHLVPYYDKKKRQKVAQFQLGYKGLIQLALRSGQYHAINVAEVYAGEVRAVNRFTGEIVFGERAGEAVSGYLAYLKLNSGFEKYIYMTTDEIQAHAARYSKTYDQDTSLWKTNFPAMARKTLLRAILGRWGILSIEMRTAMAAEVPPDADVVEGPSGDNGNGRSSAADRAADRAALFGADESTGEIIDAERKPTPAENAAADAAILQAEAAK